MPGLTYLKMLCEQIPNIEIIKAFDNPETFLIEAEKIQFDFCIIDIEMPGINGLQVKNQLVNIPVIFATAYKEYAAEAFDLNACDYIRKPITLDRLKQAIDKTAIQIEKTRDVKENRKFVHFNTNKGKTLIYIDEIAFVKTSNTDSRDKILVLLSGKEYVVKNMSFEVLTQKLPITDFSRINKQEIISLKIVVSYSSEMITTNMLNLQGKPLQFLLGSIYRIDFFQLLKN